MLSIDNIVEMLHSKDYELRKLAGNFLFDTYNLDFNIYFKISWKNLEYKFSLIDFDSSWGFRNVKEIIYKDVIITRLFRENEIKNLLDLIKEYNGIK